jgi:carbon monoxide dehydrogenase subunit G
MLIPIVIAAVALPGALAAYAATRPNTFRHERSTTMQAPPEAILPHITDFRRWEAWSPYEKLDPEMKKSFSGAASGPGAVYTWEGRKAGAGRMEIRETSPRRVVIQLDFSKPFKANNTAEFTLEPEGAATRVTWAMYGPTPFVSKLMGILIDLDRMIGKDFAAGLASLKTIAERPAATATR